MKVKLKYSVRKSNLSIKETIDTLLTDTEPENGVIETLQAEVKDLKQLVGILISVLNERLINQDELFSILTSADNSFKLSISKDVK